MTSGELVQAFVRRGVYHMKPSKNFLTAAVCVVVGGPYYAPALCFIKRSERSHDPWSGHMAFPGGRVKPTDNSTRDAGERETAEEVGLDLTHFRYLGNLPEMSITRRGRPLMGWLQPFVYLCSPDLPSLRPQPSEVAEAMWIPVTHLIAPGNLTSVRIADGNRRLVFPGIAYGSEVIWGLTFRVLSSLLELARS